MKNLLLILSLVSFVYSVDTKQVSTTTTGSFTTFNQRVAQIGSVSYETFYQNSVLPVDGKLQIPATFKATLMGNSRFTSYNNSSSDTIEFLGSGWKFSDNCFGDSLVVKFASGAVSEVWPEWWGNSAGALFKALKAANGSPVVLAKGTTYQQALCSLTVPVNIVGNNATIQGTGTSIFNITGDISYFICKNANVTYTSNPATSSNYFINNWPSEVVGEEHQITKMDLEDNNFGYAKVRCSGRFSIPYILRNTWEHDSTTEGNGFYLSLSTGDTAYDSLTDGGIVKDNIFKVWPTNGDNQDIIKVTGSRSSVIIDGNLVYSNNPNALGNVDVYTGLNRCKIINNDLKNTQIVRKMSGTAGNILGGYDIIDNNNITFTSNFRQKPHGIECRGSWFKVTNNTIVTLRDSLKSIGIYLYVEDSIVGPLATQTAQLGIVSFNTFDFSSANTTSCGIQCDGGGAGGGGSFSMVGNIQRGGQRMINSGRFNSALIGNVWNNTTNAAGTSGMNASAGSAMIGNVCTQEGSSYLGNAHNYMNPGFNATIGTTVAGGSNINANAGNIFFVNGTGNIGIDSGVIGQELIILCSGGSPTFVHGTLRLQGSDNITMANYDVLVLKKVNTTQWWQVAYKKTSMILKLYGLTVEGKTTINDTLDVNGYLSVSNTIQTESATNAKIISSDTARATNLTGSIRSVGGISAAKNIYVGDTTSSTSSTTGALVVSGGVGVAKGINAGGKITSGDTVKTGATSYVQIDSVNGLLLGGNATVWDDIRINPGSFDRPGTADPALVAYDKTFLWEFEKNDSATFTVQMPHSYNPQDSIFMHVHWTPGSRGDEEGTATVGWKIAYTWAMIDSVFPAWNVVDLSDACKSTDGQHLMSPEVGVAGTGRRGSSMLLCNIKRTDTGADDTWAGTVSGQLPFLLEVDFHYPINKIGTATRTPN